MSGRRFPPSPPDLMLAQMPVLLRHRAAPASERWKPDSWSAPAGDNFPDLRTSRPVQSTSSLPLRTD